MALLAVLARRVEVALHDVVLLVDRRQAFRRLDEDQAVHAVGHVHADRCGGAVIDVEARVERLEREARRMARRGEARRRAAAGTGDAVQVDVVRHLDSGWLLQVELDRVALAHADEAAGHGAAEGPERVGHAFGNRHVLFDHVEFDDHLRGRVAVRRAAAPSADWSAPPGRARLAAARSRPCASRRCPPSPARPTWPCRMRRMR